MLNKRPRCIEFFVERARKNIYEKRWSCIEVLRAQNTKRFAWSAIQCLISCVEIQGVSHILSHNFIKHEHRQQEAKKQKKIADRKAKKAAKEAKIKAEKQRKIKAEQEKKAKAAAAKKAAQVKAEETRLKELQAKKKSAEEAKTKSAQAAKATEAEIAKEAKKLEALKK